MKDERLEEIVQAISDNKSPVEVLEVLTELVDEVDQGWKRRIRSGASAAGDESLGGTTMQELFPDVFWEDKDPEEYVASAGEPALPPHELV